MATTDDRTPLLALCARIDERFFAPLKRSTFATRTWFSVTLALVLALHGGVLGYFLWRDWTKPPEVAKAEETPVEVVVETPPAPPQEKTAQQQEIEKPASSAPRAESDTKLDTEKTDAETRAPKAETPPTDGDPQPAKDAAETNKDTSQDADAEAAAENPDNDKPAEALDKATPEPKTDTPKPAKAKVAAKPKHAKSALQQLAGLSDLPDYKFAKRAKRSPVSGGDEDSRYLAIVYGLIARNLRAAGDGSVTVVFELDDEGDVLEIQIYHSSGDVRADAAVVDAVKRSSPFPPPPPDRPHSLRATIDFSRQTMGER